MIGWDPKTEVAPSSCQRKKEKRKLVVGQGSWQTELKPKLRVKEEPVKEERFSTGIHRYKLSKLWDCFSSYPILYTPPSLSLSLSLSLSQVENERKQKKKDIYAHVLSIYDIFKTLKVYICV